MRTETVDFCPNRSLCVRINPKSLRTKRPKIGILGSNLWANMRGSCSTVIYSALGRSQYVGVWINPRQKVEYGFLFLFGYSLVPILGRHHTWCTQMSRLGFSKVNMGSATNPTFLQICLLAGKFCFRRASSIVEIYESKRLRYNDLRVFVELYSV